MFVTGINNFDLNIENLNTISTKPSSDKLRPNSAKTLIIKK